jgi:glycosyltransferase involved in cell wall biosynthesis
MTRVSVCITHYERPDKLAATLESLARQTRLPDEVFLWDDCSPQDPAEIAHRFSKRFPHFVYHRNPRNLGMPGNLNAVLAQATGDYVANLHDADVFHPQLLEKWVQALEQHPTAGLVFCGLDATRDNPAGPEMIVPDIAPLTPGIMFFDRWFVGCRRSIIWGTVMVRKSVYERVLPFAPRYHNWADVDMWMRICRDHDIAYVREPLIVLDNTHTKQRKFSWYRMLLMQEMCFANIRATYAGDRLAMRAALVRQRKCLRLSYLRFLAGSIKWLDFPRLRTGLGLAARVFRSDATTGDGRLVSHLSVPV